MVRATDAVTFGEGFTLPVDYVAARSIALLGKRGAGKTATCRVLTEELFAAHVQTVIVDPMGVFWGLRSSADGLKDGLPIPVFGGDHADAPLEPSAGVLMADLAVEEGLSMVLDLSLFSSRTQERSFARDFFDRLYRRNKDLVHLIVDEADLFGPQKPRREDAPLLVALENIVRRGRNKAIGVTMASQRAAVLNKDLLSQVDVLAALRVTGPQDRAAIQDWVRGQGDGEQWAKIAPSLPSLKTGEAWWWAPERGVLERVQGRMAVTFDSSPTRERGQSNRQPKTFADVDLGAISKQIAGTVERAKQTDPKELTRRIAELQRELVVARQQTPAPHTVEVRVDVPVIPAGVAQGIAALRAQVDEAISHGQLLEKNIQALEKIISAPPPPPNEVPARPASGQFAPSTRAPRSTPEPMMSVPPNPVPGPAPSIPRRDVENISISPARRNLLNALASLASIGINPAQKVQLALWAGVSARSSGYSNNLGALRSIGFLDYPAPGAICLTPEGHQEVDPAAIASLPTNAELHDHVHSLLTPARWRLVDQLIRAYPTALSKAELAEQAGVSPASSGYSNNLGALRSMGLLDYPTSGHVAATPALFFAGP